MIQISEGQEVFGLQIKEATSDTIEFIIRHRVEMFRTMGWSHEDLETSGYAAKQFLENIWEDNPICHLAYDNNLVIGGYALTLYQTLPSAKNPSGFVGYIHNLFVEPESRGKGIGSQLIDHAIDECKKLKAGKVELHATDMGTGIYERAGFTKSDNHYAMTLESS